MNGSDSLHACASILTQPGEDWVCRLQDLVCNRNYSQVRHEARVRYCPELSYGRHFAPPGSSARSAAVMILLQQTNPGTHWRDCYLPLTVRPLNLADHPGQISLPGGRLEKDETASQAAQREFCEELGVSEFTGRILGSLLPMWVFNSDYYLTPFLAIHTGAMDYKPCSREVARVIDLPVSELLKQDSPSTGSFSRGCVSWNAGVFNYQQDCIWGATAMILAELAALLRLLEKVD